MSLHPEPARERRRRLRLTERLLKTPKTIDVVLDHVRNGGGLISLCETWGVRYSDIISWIRADKSRDAAYTQAMADRSEWTDEMILNELRVASNFDIRRLYYQTGRKKGQRIPVAELDIETARMLHEVKLDGTVKAYDRFKALELLGKNRRLLVDRAEVEGTLRLEDILAASNAPPPAPPA